MFSEAIDEQAKHYDESQGNDPFRLFHNDRGGQEQRVFEKAVAPFDAALLLVGADQLFIRKLRGIEDVGPSMKQARRRPSSAAALR